jgi:uncharacterized membrane protein (UPF0127 family)
VRPRVTFAWRRFEIGGATQCLPAALTLAAQERGLMGVRNPIPMVFVFTPPQPVAFWMKATPTPLTGAWVSPAGRVVGYWHGDPQSLVLHPSPGRVRYVIEYPPGRVPPPVGTRVTMAGHCPSGPRL